MKQLFTFILFLALFVDSDAQQVLTITQTATTYTFGAQSDGFTIDHRKFDTSKNILIAYTGVAAGATPTLTLHQNNALGTNFTATRIVGGSIIGTSSCDTLFLIVTPPAGVAGVTTANLTDIGLNQEPKKVVLENFHYTVFTDFKGFKGDQPNGIVQSEFYFDWRLRDNTNKPAAEICHNIILGCNLTKLGENLRYRDVNVSYDTTETDTSMTKHLHYLDLVRYTNFEGYAKMNLLYFRLDKIGTNNPIKIPIRLYIDIFGNVNSSGVRDTTLTVGSREFNVTSFGGGASLKLASACIRNKKGHLDFEIGYTPYILKMYNNNFKLSGGPIYSPETNPLNNKYLSEVQSNVINRFDFRVQYAPKLEHPENNIFFRVMFHTNTVSGTLREAGVNNNSFLQVQLGYAGSLTDLMPEKK